MPFMDTDGPCWSQFGGNGLESHGVIVLGNDAENNFLALGGTSCSHAQTSFWTKSKGYQKGTTIFYCLSFGLPGALVEAGGDGAKCQENFSITSSSSATALLEQYADEC